MILSTFASQNESKQNMKMTKYKLGELVEVTRGASLSGQFYAEEGKLIRLTLGNFNMNGGGFKENTSKTDLYFTGTVRDEFILNKGDIITPLTEQSLGLLGTTARISESGKYIQSQDVALVRCKEGRLDPNFCYYLISSSIVRQQLSAAAQQTKIRHTSPEKIKDCTVWVPDFETQKSIGRILTDIDNKIAVNRQINDNLEAMAKQLYDYWFVQFDFPNEDGKPYKSSGGAMVWNENLKREIPQGWNDCKIKDFMRIFTGKKDVSKAVPGNYKFFSCAPEPISSNEYIYDGYAVLVSGNGSYTGRVGFYKGKFDLYQRTYACVLDEDEHNISFFYYTLRYLFQPIYSGGKHGSSIPYIVLGDLADFRFAFNETICTKFVDATKPMFDEQLLRQKEIEVLTKQRDELLPLLMNGQATVNYHLSARNYPLPIAHKKAIPIVVNQIISRTFIQKSDSHIPSPRLQTSQIRCS